MYDIKIHSKNLVYLENVIKFLSDEKNCNNDLIFSEINYIADFINVSSDIYSKVNSYKNLTDKLVFFIEWCNSINYNIKEVYNELKILKKAIIGLVNELRECYKYKIILKANDKLGLSNFFEKYNSTVSLKNDKIIQVFGVVICNKNDEFKYTKKYDYVVYYEELITLFDEYTNKYFENYRYSFLENSIERAKRYDVKSISVGLSYGMFGIVEELFLEKNKNLCLSSQDIFYSNLIAKNIISENNSIRDCYIALSYYSLFFDLSSSINERIKIDNLYYPILKDKHNYKDCKCSYIERLEKIDNDVLKEILEEINIYKLYSKLLYKECSESYFNKYNRYLSNILPKDIKYNDIKIEEKEFLGKIRAEQHNKFIGYEETKNENIKILQELINFLNTKGIGANIVIFPNSKYYKRYYNDKFNYEFYEALTNISGKGGRFKVLDLSKDDDFTEKDFIDYDHLNYIGAKKATKKIIKMKKFKIY